MVADRISQMIDAIKSANAGGKSAVTVPYSSLVLRSLEVLEREGFVGASTRKGKKPGNQIEVALLQVDGRPRIHDVKRVSKLSRRVYRGFKDISKYKNGFGIRVLTTPKGVMSDKQARKEKLGGEVLFELW
jgi:small subunit ribosomal protein S8